MIFYYGVVFLFVFAAVLLSIALGAALMRDAGVDRANRPRSGRAGATILLSFLWAVVLVMLNAPVLYV